ncbi:DUF1330 domain-containing protein [Streptomyces sp. NPDC051636]|uniref:DUF1330 domain-containing protein n=1 Tax=Streptomyces sp. NPDC051636 TaxID=3365663 RepID=UPI00379E3706
MSAYLVIDIHPTDAEEMGRYSEGAMPILQKFGGKVIAFDPAAVPLEGDWTPTQVILVEFPDKEAIQAYLAAPEYQPWKRIRQASSVGRSVAVDSV